MKAVGSGGVATLWSVRSPPPEPACDGTEEAVPVRELRKQVYRAIAQVSSDPSVHRVHEMLTTCQNELRRVRVHSVAELIPAFASISASAPSLQVRSLRALLRRFGSLRSLPRVPFPSPVPPLLSAPPTGLPPPSVPPRLRAGRCACGL